MHSFHLSLICSCVLPMGSSAWSGQTATCQDCQAGAINRTSLLQISSHSVHPIASSHTNLACMTQRSSSSLMSVKTEATGNAVNVAELNFWTLDNLYYTTLFSGMHGSCIQDQDVVPPVAEVSAYQSSYEFERSYLEQFGLGVEPSFFLSATLESDIREQGSNSKNYSGKTRWWRTSRTHRRTQVDSDCLRCKEYLSPFALVALEQLPTENDDGHTMDEWVKKFVGPFGTHVITGMSYGASVQAVDILESSCNSSAQCVPGLAAHAPKDAVQSNCTENDECAFNSVTSCYASGGVNSTKEICGSGAALEAFLSGANISVISVNMTPVHKVFAEFPEYSKHSKQMEKAVAFSLCDGLWTYDSGSGEHFCNETKRDLN